MGEPERKPSGESLWAHEPLPYVVRLRLTQSDDAPAMAVVHRCRAYSAFEAVMQALMTTSGRPSGDDTNVRVEGIEPDYPQWLADRSLALAEQVAGAAHKGDR